MNKERNRLVNKVYGHFPKPSPNGDEFYHWWIDLDLLDDWYTGELSKMEKTAIDKSKLIELRVKLDNIKIIDEDREMYARCKNYMQLLENIIDIYNSK